MSEPQAMYVAGRNPPAAWWWIPIGRGWHLHYAEDENLPFERSSLVAHLQPRPHYCDRGRWIAQQFVFDVDHSDAFPRYYMDLERAKAEVFEWVRHRLTCYANDAICPNCASREHVTCQVVEQEFKVTLKEQTHEVSTPAPEYHCGRCGLDWTGFDAEVRRTLRQEALVKELGKK